MQTLVEDILMFPSELFMLVFHKHNISQAGPHVDNLVSTKFGNNHLIHSHATPYLG